MSEPEVEHSVVPIRRQKDGPPAYERIAVDIAKRILKHEFLENTKVYGRSVMSSEYGVSPETIRKSFMLLEEMGVVEVKQNSGVTILSRTQAEKFLASYGSQLDSRSMLEKLRQLLEIQEKLQKDIVSISHTVLEMAERYCHASPFSSFECIVPPESPAIGETTKTLQLWQHTQATLVAIRRNGTIFLSPGPDFSLLERDTLVLAGDIMTRNAVEALLNPN